MRRGRYERSAAVLYATIKRRGGLSVQRRLERAERYEQRLE